MLQLGLHAFTSRLATMGIRGKVLVLAGLGLFGLPCVLWVLVWRDLVLIQGLAPLFAIGSASAAAIVALIGLDLSLRPVSMTSAALGSLLNGGVPPDLPQSKTGPAGQLMNDTQQVIDELIALRAENQDQDATGYASGLDALTETIRLSSDPAQAIIVLRLCHAAAWPTTAKGGLLTGKVLSETIRRLRLHYGTTLPVAMVGSADLAYVLPLQHSDLAATTDFSLDLDRVISDLRHPVFHDDFEVSPIFLAGVAARSLGDMPERVIEQAIAALEIAAPATPLVIFNDDIREKARDTDALAHELRNALRNDEFELYYQPIMDVANNCPVGAEALIRWHNPARGFVAPAVFIPLAEASGLFDPIGHWVLQMACQQAANWDPSLCVSINMGARQFQSEDLTWHVSEAISAAGIRPDQLEIELTEVIAFAEHHHTKSTLTALRDIGVQIAIDDFGTGHADMGQLRSLPLTRLKIDREFVTDVHCTPGSQAICDALLALGAGLGLEVVAEGTERAEEVEFLSRRGCSLFQGYYFARPVPAYVLGSTFTNLRLRDAG